MIYSPGRALIAFGLVLLVIGAIVEFLPWLPLGRLPGDIRIASGNTRIYIPIVSSIVVSILLSLLLSLFMRGAK